MVEIMRALKPRENVFAFDKPASSLTSDELARLFDLIRKLKAEGLGIIYVSHRLQEVMAIPDRVVVLKDGQQIGDLITADTSEDKIARLMVGRELIHGFKRQETTRDEVVVRVEGLFRRWHRDISLQIRAGEIPGFAGLVGAGRTELAKVIFGEYRRDGGKVILLGKDNDIRSSADAICANIGFAPENRKAHGLILVRSVIDDATTAIYSRLARWAVLRMGQMVAAVGPMIRQPEVKIPSLTQEVGKQSGGNQQKVVLARLLAVGLRLLTLDEPTRPVDVRAKAKIYRPIGRPAADSMAIMMISSEMPGLLALSDRIEVMRDGRLSPLVEKQDATEAAIVVLALDTRAPA